jgi:predicted O-methyltransferase YrrM
MTTFAEALRYSCTTAVREFYEEGALRLLWDAVRESVPKQGTIVEIGCCRGRSTSMILQAARGLDATILLVDPFEVTDVMVDFARNIHPLGVPFVLYVMTSERALQYMPPQFDLVHIDGDHTEAGVTVDCAGYLPRLRSGGLAVVHDYRHPCCPDVERVVDCYTEGWQDVAWAEMCGVRRKP